MVVSQASGKLGVRELISFLNFVFAKVALLNKWVNVLFNPLSCFLITVRTSLLQVKRNCRSI